MEMHPELYVQKTSRQPEWTSNTLVGWFVGKITQKAAGWILIKSVLVQLQELFFLIVLLTYGSSETFLYISQGIMLQSWWTNSGHLSDFYWASKTLTFCRWLSQEACVPHVFWNKRTGHPKGEAGKAAADPSRHQWQQKWLSFHRWGRGALYDISQRKQEEQPH